MHPITLEHVVKAPSHVVECSGTDEYAYTLAKDTKTFSKTAWKNSTEDDLKEIEAINATLPENCARLEISFTGKFGKSLCKFYLAEDCIVGFEDEKIFSLPDSIFLQRVSPFTKTFDMVCFYGKKYEIFHVVDRKDLEAIRDWYPKKIFSCSADPLPLKFVEEFLEGTPEGTAEGGKDIYEALFNELFAVEESSASEYEQSSESDEEYESDDVHESSEGEQEVSEYESESDGEDDYQPDEEEDDDDDDEAEEAEEDEEAEDRHTKKKRKMF